MALKYKIYTIKAASIETGLPIVDMPCGSCNDCCSKLGPFLTQKEFESGQYMYTLISTNDSIPAIAIPRKDDGCFYLINGVCSIYERRPLACRQFDCREGHHPKITNKFLPENQHYITGKKDATITNMVPITNTVTINPITIIP